MPARQPIIATSRNARRTRRSAARAPSPSAQYAPYRAARPPRRLKLASAPGGPDHCHATSLRLTVRAEPASGQASGDGMESQAGEFRPLTAQGNALIVLLADTLLASGDTRRDPGES